MTCVDCGAPLPVPTPDPFRCDGCRKGRTATHKFLEAIAPLAAAGQQLLNTYNPLGARLDDPEAERQEAYAPRRLR